MSHSSSSVDFLLAEYDYLGELWRHTDSRIEASVNMYLTTAAILVPGALLFHQSFSNPRISMIASVLGALVFATMGVFISGRVLRAHQIKAEYINGLNLIRKYFSDNDPVLAPYLLFPVAGAAVKEQRVREVLRARWLRRFIATVLVGNCILVGFATASMAWLLGVFENRALLGIGLTGAFLFGLGWILFNREPLRNSQWDGVSDESPNIGTAPDANRAVRGRRR